MAKIDYTKVPKQLIYIEKDDVDDFLEDSSDSLEHIFLERLTNRSFIKKGENAYEYVLAIFNNAAYICTLIKMEKHPSLFLNKYFDLAVRGNRDILWNNHILPATMALVCNWLHYYEHYNTEAGIIKNIRDNFQDWDKKGAPEGKDDFFYLLLTQNFHPILSRNIQFTPRDIRDEEIDDVDIGLGVDYAVEAIKKLPCKEDKLRILEGTIEQLEDREEIDPGCNSYGFNNLRIINILSDVKDEVMNEPEVISADIKEKKPTQDVHATEIEGLRKQLAHLGQELQEARIAIEQKEEKIKDLQEKEKGLTREQAPIFVYAMAKHMAFTFKNKKAELAPLIHDLFGWGTSSMEKRLCEGYSSTDKEAVAKLFDSLCPSFAQQIRDLK